MNVGDCVMGRKDRKKKMVTHTVHSPGVCDVGRGIISLYFKIWMSNDHLCTQSPCSGQVILEKIFLCESRRPMKDDAANQYALCP